MDPKFIEISKIRDQLANLDHGGDQFMERVKSLLSEHEEQCKLVYQITHRHPRTDQEEETFVTKRHLTRLVELMQRNPQLTATQLIEQTYEQITCSCRCRCLK